MDNQSPLAYFITWSVYGTHLQGHRKGWRKHGQPDSLAQPRLEAWHVSRLKHPILELDAEARHAVKTIVERHCLHRTWRLWGVNPRSNHVHVVVTAESYSGSSVRDQLKANATTALRNHHVAFLNRPVWAQGGDWDCINSEDALERAIHYVMEAQDLKWKDIDPN